MGKPLYCAFHQQEQARQGKWAYNQLAVFESVLLLLGHVGVELSKVSRCFWLGQGLLENS